MSGVLAFCDVETTGLGPDRLAWEFACIRRDAQGVETTWHFFIDVPIGDADPGALRVGRYYDRHPASPLQPNPPDGVPVVGERTAANWVLVATHNAVLVGSNPAFDAATLAALLSRQGLVESWHYAVRDIVPLAAGFLLGQGKTVESWKSDDLSRAVGVNPDHFDRHTALGDCLWSKAVYDAVTGGGS